MMIIRKAYQVVQYPLLCMAKGLAGKGSQGGPVSLGIVKLVKE